MMTGNESMNIEEQFARLASIDASERTAILRELIGQDREKALRLAALIDAHDNETLALDSLPDMQFDQLLTRPSEALIGVEIGGWRLLEELGQGGMGVVVGVERVSEGVTQRAAMKLLSIPTFDSVATARFIREVSVLARLDHPGICRLLDWGTSQQGWRYLVLERIDGHPINAYGDALPVAQRLDLVRRVAEAVNAAHRELV